MKFRLLIMVCTCALAIALVPGASFAGDVTPEQVAKAIAGGQQYLKNHQLMDGSWSDSNYSRPYAATGAAVAALLETGVAPDDPCVVNGIEYIKNSAQAAGLTSTSLGGGSTYDHNICLVALSLYASSGHPTITETTLIEYARNYTEEAQYVNPASDHNGSWSYGGHSAGDNSNTQFGVMGMWYANRFLGDPIAGTPWAERVLEWTENCARDDGMIAYHPDNTSFLGTPMTGAGIWSLAMTGRDDYTAVNKALDWFADPAVYRWDKTVGPSYGNMTAYYYSIYAMAKGLQATVGSQNKLGTPPNDHNWGQDLVNEMVGSKAIWDAAPAEPGEPTPVHWQGSGWLDGGDILATSWVLMSIAFVDPNVEKKEALLPDPPNPDYPILGLITLQTTGDVNISKGARDLVGIAIKPTTVTLPVGATRFQLNNVPIGGQTKLKIFLPPGALDPNNPNSFVNPDGTLKAGINFFKVKNGEWKGDAAIPIVVDPQGGFIEVTLTDGGPGDEDGVANGTIVDPGAPGFNVGQPAPPTPTPTPEPASPTYNKDSDFFGCFIDSLK